MTEPSRTLTVAQALVHALAAQYSEVDGVRRRLIPGVFGIFGHGNVAGLGQALDEHGHDLDLPLIRPQNEQAGVHAAAAYAKHAGRAATWACAASVGPGSTNMVTGAALATVNRLPVLLLPSDFFANRIPDPLLQQLEHPTEHDATINDAFRPVSRFYSRIDRPEQLLSALPQALRVLTDPAAAGAVVLSLPEDVQAEAYVWPEAFFAPRTWRIRRPHPDPAETERVAALIAGARAPLIVAGGGVTYADANETLAAFAERYAIPVAETQAGRGALRWDHPLAVGPIGANGGSAANALAREADLVLAIGTRLGDFATSSRRAFAPDAVFAGLNVVPLDAHKLNAAPLVADARAGLEALDAALGGRRVRSAHDTRRAQVRDLVADWNARVDRARAHLGSAPEADGRGGLAQAGVLGLVEEVFGTDAVVINAAGSMPGDLLALRRPTDPRAHHVEYGYSCMGYEVPAGIGVRLAEADPDRPVVVLIGDGSWLMMHTEIVTAVVEDLDLTVVLIDNDGYQSIHGLQRSVGSPQFGTELRRRAGGRPHGRLDGPSLRLDYAAGAAALGAEATYADDPTAARAALEAARSARGVRVVVLRTDPEARLDLGDTGGWWDVPPAEVSGQAAVREARAAYDAARAQQIRYPTPAPDPAPDPDPEGDLA